MKKLIPLFAFFAISNSYVFSQGCLPEGITFTSQEQIDNFQANYPGCTEIEGNVYIGKIPEGTDINNLNGLNVVTTIGGNLRIFYNASLTSLSGLENLTSTGGHLDISSSYGLTSLSGLESLNSVGGYLDISHNYHLTSLSGLENLTSIGEYLTITDNDDLLSLSGLENLTSIGTYFWIDENVSLTEITALGNLTSIGGDLQISSNDVLISLSGLEGLSTIEGELSITNNEILIDFSGLGSLTTISGGLVVTYNGSLTSFSGLNNLISIGGDLNISINGSLTSFSGLENLTSIGEDLSIHFNSNLASLAGLENLTSIGGELWIWHNPSLSACNLQGLCDYLLNPAGSINIFENSPGCNNPYEIASDCDFTMPCMPYGNYYLMNQFEIDNFHTNYPGCLEIDGSFTISGMEITNLNGISGITSIGASLGISTSFALTTLTGMESLTSIGENLLIDENIYLTSISGLQNLNSIGGNIMIRFNDDLTSLSGLDSIDAGSILNLDICCNSQLSDCDVKSMCDYLAAPNGTVEIYNNAPGCNNSEEIEEHCLTFVAEYSGKEAISLFPNPASSFITINIKEDITLEQAIIYNHLGQKVLVAKPVNNTVDVSGLKAGMYILETDSDETRYRTKMIKHN